MKFKTKTILGIAFIEIILLVIIVLSAISFMTQSAETQLVQRANATANILAKAVEKDVLSFDISSLDEIVQEVIKSEDIAYIRIIGYGKTLVSQGDPKALQQTTTIDKSLNDVDDGIFDVRVDLKTNTSTYGHIDIGFSNQSITTQITTARDSMTGIATIEVLLVALFSFFIGHYLTKSLTQLTQAAKKLSQEGPGYQVTLKSSDELGQVASAFNQMSSSLAKSYDDLKIARHQAEDASQSKSLFLASMSHEIRTPLNGVIGLLSLLKETSLDKHQTHLVETASQSGFFLMSVINDILDYTKMESNTLSLDRKPFDLHECIDQVINSFRPSACFKSICLEPTITPSVPQWVKGDQYRVQQILHNLIGNAVKFTEQGSIQVIIRADRNKAGILLTGQIIDTGIGIEPSMIDQLFEEFTMADNTYSRTQEGSGLGLAICRKLCELMDGQISAESQPGEGSTFTFQIRLGESDGVQVSEEPVTTIKPEWKHARILVAEDNKANQIVIENMFLHAGITIELAHNGLEAVEKVKNGHFDLVFMDMSMPQMDGMQACQEIRAMADKQKAELPIIALTAHALHGDKERFITAGLTDYLSKPVRLSQLLEKMALYLKTDEIEISTDLPEGSLQPAPESAAEHPAEPDGLVDETIIQQVIADTSIEVLPVLIDHYVEECQQRVKKISCAINHKKAECLKFETHTLGSSALALGNRNLAELARKIEHLCIDGKDEEAYQAGEALPQLAADSLAALQLRKTMS
ncbi:Autoinducer 2 sensor kinase/phosphatase LuxQ [Vibrio aerogenes CECT 7868]|uniref:histidine kinase n=2 Tax=Vibrio aerogenes TaxID=92172 RepID=A0A1M5ZAU0_9VIBR|nr:Autoinducer 2 sensor kinase/phosphatase LuxQ [Vibrio aerogenes CECT 7868]